MKEIRNIVLVGAGNVATHLGRAFHEAGLNIVQVWSRTASAAERLAKELDSLPVSSLKDVQPGADLYLISVVDDAIAEVAGAIAPAGKFLVHTSGSVPMSVFEPYTQDFGVIYPVQTFSRTRAVDFSNLPVCIEANSLANLERLNQLVSKITGDVRTVPSDQRKMLHLAAVFACNFPNFMYQVADSIVTRAKLDFDLLKPLIGETAEKVQSLSPAEAQTGPAIRGDQQVLDRHIELLRDLPEFQKLYKEISKAIGDTRNKIKPENDI